MRQLLAPILFDDDDRAHAQAARASIVAPAQRSASAKLKALTKQTAEGIKVRSFQTLIGICIRTVPPTPVGGASGRISALSLLVLAPK